jgi:hypothetical protein
MFVMSVRRICAFIIVISLMGCDGKQSPSTEKFAGALQRYYDDHPECVALPIDLSVGTPAAPSEANRRLADALVRAELVAVMPGVTPGVMQYSLTGAGERAIRKGPDAFLGGMTLCFARRRIVKVASFTEPAETLGVKASRVSYDYELQDVAPWAGSASIQEAFPQIQEALAHRHSTAVEGVVLTSDGWVDEHMVQ